MSSVFITGEPVKYGGMLTPLPFLEPIDVSAFFLPIRASEANHAYFSSGQVLPPSATANLASLSRIRSLVSGIEGSNGVGEERGVGFSRPEPDTTSARRGGSPPPDAVAVFKGVRVLLEQNTEGQPGYEEVRGR